MSVAPPGRRERYRQATREEAKRLALRQIAEQGAGALSLNGIAHQMGMTGPALFRYVGSRDALLTELVVDAYNDLGAALWAAVEETEGLSPAARLRRQAAVYRAWALANRHRYLLIFGTPVPGFHAPAERTRPAAQRAMAAAIALLADVVLPEPLPPADAFDRELESWAERVGAPPLPGYLLRQAIIGWTRWHGVLSLELAGHFDSTLPNPALVYEAEVDELVRLLETSGQMEPVPEAASGLKRSSPVETVMDADPKPR